MGGTPILAHQITPAYDAIEVSPNDSNDIPAGCRSLYVGTGGNLKVVMKSGRTVTHTNVQDGEVLPIRVTRVFSTDTTASNILAYY